MREPRDDNDGGNEKEMKDWEYSSVGSWEEGIPN